MPNRQTSAAIVALDEMKAYAGAPLRDGSGNVGDRQDVEDTRPQAQG